MPTLWDKFSQGPSKEWTHWPHVFPFTLNTQVMACADSTYLNLSIIAITALKFFYSNIVPSPVEIARKTVSGSYKCGFYLKVKVKSPLDIIWRSARMSRAIAGITSPITTGLFYVWAATSAYEGLQTAATLYNAFARCDADPNTGVMADAHTFLPDPAGSGAPVFATTLYDPMANQIPAITTFLYEPGRVHLTAFGYLTSVGATVDSAEVYFDIDGAHVALQELPPIGPGESTEWFIEYDFQATSGGAVQPRITYTQHNQNPFSTSFICTRFIMRIPAQPEPPITGSIFPLLPSCSAPGIPPLAMPTA